MMKTTPLKRDITANSDYTKDRSRVKRRQISHTSPSPLQSQTSIHHLPNELIYLIREKITPSRGFKLKDVQNFANTSKEFNAIHNKNLLKNFKVLDKKKLLECADENLDENTSEKEDYDQKNGKFISELLNGPFKAASEIPGHPLNELLECILSDQIHPDYDISKTINLITNKNWDFTLRDLIDIGFKLPPESENDTSNAFLSAHLDQKIPIKYAFIIYNNLPKLITKKINYDVASIAHYAFIDENLFFFDNDENGNQKWKDFINHYIKIGLFTKKEDEIINFDTPPSAELIRALKTKLPKLLENGKTIDLKTFIKILSQNPEDPAITRQDLINIGLIKSPDNLKEEVEIKKSHRKFIYKKFIDLLLQDEEINMKAIENLPAYIVNNSNIYKYLKDNIYHPDKKIKLIIENIFKSNCFINIEDRNGRTLLFNATIENEETLIKLFIKNGWDINYISYRNLTALNYAFSPKTLKLLIENGAKKNIRNMHGRTPFTEAIYRQHYKLIENLISSEGYTPDQYIEMQEKGKGLYTEDIYKKTAIDYIRDNERRYINRTNNSGLILAAKNNWPYVARLFIEAGDNIRAVDGNQNTALHHAYKNGHFSLSDVLIRNDKKINFPHDFQQGIYRNLIGDANKQDEYGKTPLHHAFEHGHLALADILLHHGARIDLPDNQGKDPLHYLKDNIDKTDLFGKTLLHHAFENGHFGLADLLIFLDADIKLKDKFENNPLFYAMPYENKIKTFPFSEKTQKILNENEKLHLIELEHAFINAYIDKSMLSE